MLAQRIAYYIQAAFDLALKTPRIEQTFGHKLVENYKRDTRKDLDLKSIIEKIASHDPTPNKEYLFWICKLYAGDGIKRFEDIGARINPELEQYINLKNKKKIPVEDRDINRFKTIKAFEDFLDKYADKELDGYTEDEQLLFEHGDARIVGAKRQIKVVEILSLKAAMYYGRGTKWCTAAKYNNAYEDYADGLYVIFTPKSKYQLHFGSSQFADTHDEDVDYLEFIEQYPEVMDILKKEALNHHSIRFVKNPTEEQQLVAVKIDGYEIEWIKNPSEKIQLEAVKQNTSCICKIQNPTKKVQLETVSRYPEMFFILKNPSEAVKLAAVKRDGNQIAYIKDPSEELQLAALRQTPDALFSINNPTEKVQLEAIDLDYKLFDFIKDPTEKAQLAAIKHDIKLIHIIKNPAQSVIDYVRAYKT